MPPPAAAARRRVLFTAVGRDPRCWLLALLVAVIVFGVFCASLGNDFNYDDEENIIQNPQYRGLGPERLRWMFSTFHMGHYQPLTWITLAIDYLIWGQDPRGYHLTNLLLHVGNAVLVYFLALALLGRDVLSSVAADGPDRSAICPSWSAHWAAGLAALLFAVHPLRVESVVWVTERRDVLSSFFLLWSVLLYLRAHRQPRVSKRTVWVVLSLVAYVLSLLSRAMGVTLPVVLLLLDWYPLGRLGRRPPAADSTQHEPLAAGADISRPSTWGVFAEKLLFALPAIGFAVVAPLAQQAAGATLPLSEHGAVARLAQACYGLVFYLWKTVVPSGLAPLYRLHTPLAVLSAKYVLSGLTVAAGLIVLGLYGRRHPWLAVPALLYAVLLSPVLGFAQAGRQEVADRYSYLPLIGWMILLAGGWLRLVSRPGGAGKLVAGAMAVGVLAALSLLTWRQVLVWRTSESLWRHAVAHAPSPTAHHNLGAVLARQGRLQEAIDYLRRAVAEEPNNERALRALAKAMSDVGNTEEAVPYWQRLIALKPADIAVRFEYAGIQRARGLLEEAAAQYREIIRLDPHTPGAHVNLGVILLSRGATEEAVAHFRAALAADPRHAEALYNLGIALGQQGKLDEAMAAYRAAASARPGYPEALTNLGVALEAKGQKAEAVELYRTILSKNPAFSPARYRLAGLLAQSGQRDQAVAELHELLQRDPTYEPAKRALQALQRLSGEP